jgi:hypothetical protein
MFIALGAECGVPVSLLKELELFEAVGAINISLLAERR